MTDSAGDAAPQGTQTLYKRVLLKISGEALMGDQQYGIDLNVAERVAREVSDAVNSGVEVCLVIGGGNIFRGLPLPPRAWTAPLPTIWACSRP